MNHKHRTQTPEKETGFKLFKNGKLNTNWPRHFNILTGQVDEPRRKREFYPEPIEILK